MNELTQDWYTELIDDCKTIVGEAIFNSSWVLLQGYHQLGSRVLEEKDKEPITSLVKRVSVDIGKSERLVWKSTQLAISYPDLDKLPKGKAVSVRYVFNELLPEPEGIKIDQELQEKLATIEGKYQTIVIDPPWPMEFVQLNNRPAQVVMPYPVMSLEEIKVLPINDMAYKDCNLFLWTTHRFLPDSFDLLREWGFEYHVCLTWDKTNGRAMFGFNRQSEFCLYAHKGRITVNQRGKYIPTVFTEKLREHSRKPEVFYDLLRTNTPAPRLDMFSREKRDGFDQWGNEVNKWDKTNGIVI